MYSSANIVSPKCSLLLCVLFGDLDLPRCATRKRAASVTPAATGNNIAGGNHTRDPPWTGSSYRSRCCDTLENAYQELRRSRPSPHLTQRQRQGSSNPAKVHRRHAIGQCQSRPPGKAKPTHPAKSSISLSIGRSSVVLTQS